MSGKRNWFAPLTIGLTDENDLRGRLEAILANAAGQRGRSASRMPLRRRQALALSASVTVVLVCLALVNPAGTPYDRTWGADSAFRTTRHIEETGEFFVAGGGRATQRGDDTTVEFTDNLLCWTPVLTAARTLPFGSVRARVESLHSRPGSLRVTRYVFPGVRKEELRRLHVRYDRRSGPFVLPRDQAVTATAAATTVADAVALPSGVVVAVER